MIISLIGIDGSGKTTQAKLLLLRLRRIGFKAILMYAGNTGIKLTGKYSFYVSLPIDILVNRVLRISKEEFYKRYKNIAKIEEILLFLNYVLFIALKLSFLKKVYKIVITDRYVYDYILSRMIFSGVYSRALLKLLFMIMPVPEMLIVLDLDEELAYTRKREWLLRRLKLLRKLYLKLAGLLRAFVVSSDAAIITTNIKLLRLILSALSA